MSVAVVGLLQLLVCWEIVDRCGHNCGCKHVKILDKAVKITVAG